MSRVAEVSIRPAEMRDRRAVYEWMARSDITPSMMGPPLFPEVPVPDWEAFCADYIPAYFDGTRPEFGRSFVIESGGAAVGHISYSCIEALAGCAEMDLWMRSATLCSRGLGSQAIVLLCEHLAGLGVRRVFMRPSERNPRAIRAYSKAGFDRLDSQAPEHDALAPGEYTDTVTMVLTLRENLDASDS